MTIYLAKWGYIYTSLRHYDTLALKTIKNKYTISCVINNRAIWESIVMA